MMMAETRAKMVVEKRLPPSLNNANSGAGNRRRTVLYT